MSSPGPSPTVRKETSHTVSLVLPHLAPETSVLDIGCGEGWVADELCRRWGGEIAVVDVVDVRRTRTLPFSLYDGLHLPFPDARFDIAMLNFVLHHVPDAHKVALLREALRVGAQDRLHPGGHAGDAVRSLRQPAPRRGLPPQDRQRGALRLPDPQRMDVAFPRHGGPGRREAAGTFLPIDAAAVRARPRSCSTRASRWTEPSTFPPRAGDESSSRRRSAG